MKMSPFLYWSNLPNRHGSGGNVIEEMQPVFSLGPWALFGPWESQTIQ